MTVSSLVETRLGWPGRVPVRMVMSGGPGAVVSPRSNSESMRRPKAEWKDMGKSGAKARELAEELDQAEGGEDGVGLVGGG